MTTRTTSHLIGRTGRYLINAASFPVTIIDAREHFGRIDIEIEPIGGSGAIWVERSSVRLVDDAKESTDG